jgi:hypothetical protein
MTHTYFILICTLRSGYRPFMTFETVDPIDPDDLSQGEKNGLLANIFLASGIDIEDLNPHAEILLTGFPTELERTKAFAQLGQEADGPPPHIRSRN